MKSIGIAFLLIALVAILSVTCSAQFIGINGAGYFENSTLTSEGWIKEAVGNEAWTLRVPGGAIAKFPDPVGYPFGWGMTAEGIDSILTRYGSNEEEELTGALEKWKSKASQQPNHSYLEDVIELQKAYPKLRVIYCLNIYIGNKSFDPVEYLLANGVNVVAVEMGNETYSQVKYDFNLYWTKISPIAAEARAKGIKVYHPVPAVGVRNTSSHERWITSLKAVIGGDGVCFHPYYDSREFSALKQPVDTGLAYVQIASWDFDKQFTEMKDYFPNADFIVTETNTQPSSLIGDTELNKFFVARLFEAGKQHFTDFCLHNGVSPDKYGIIYGRPQKRNTSYYAFKDAIAACEDTILVSYDTTFEITITENKTTITSCSNCKGLKGFLCSIRWARPCTVTSITYDTTYTQILIPVYDTIKCDPEPDPGGIQPLDADTLFFNNETEFRDFLVYHNLFHDYQIANPKYSFDCTKLPVANIYPAQSPDDYLHEERFTGLPFMSVVDHIRTRKMINVFIPTLKDPAANFCNVTEYYTNPFTGQVACFRGVYTWWNENGEQMFNANKKLWQLWGFNDRVVSFPIDAVHEATGYDYTFLDLFPGHDTMELSFKDCAITFPR